MLRPFSEERAIGYVVSTWPRLSQTFVLNEVLALERQGLALRVFSTKDPDGEPVHSDVSRVRSEVEYLTLPRLWRSTLAANLALAAACPVRYFVTLCHALGHRSTGVARRFFQAAHLASKLRRHPVKHLHAHFATGPTLVAMFASELTGIPYTFTTHAKDLYVDTKPELLRDRIRRAKSVITISEYNRAHLARNIDPAVNGKVRCIYNGLDLRQFPYREPPVRDLPLVLSVGRLIEKKGFGDLITAAGILRGRGRSIQVEIIGAGPLRSVLEEQIKALGLERSVALSGAQPQEIVRAAFGRADLFVLPCRMTADGDRDGIPTVLLEAMASGVPCVSTAVSGVPELIRTGQEGLLTQPADPPALADAMELLIGDPGYRHAIALRARKTVEERFSIERAALELMEVFGEARR